MAEVAHLAEVQAQAEQAGDDLFEGDGVGDVASDDRCRGTLRDFEAAERGAQDGGRLTVYDQLVALVGHLQPPIGRTDAAAEGGLMMGSSTHYGIESQTWLLLTVPGMLER
jgi:hypothetical protein